MAFKVVIMIDTLKLLCVVPVLCLALSQNANAIGVVESGSTCRNPNSPIFGWITRGEMMALCIKYKLKSRKNSSLKSIFNRPTRMMKASIDCVPLVNKVMKGLDKIVDFYKSEGMGCQCFHENTYYAIIKEGKKCPRFERNGKCSLRALHNCEPKPVKYFTDDAPLT